MKLVSLTLLILCLLTEICKALGNPRSLHLNLTVNSQSKPGQPWCQVHGSVDENPFLWYDCDRYKGTPVGLLGEKVNATKTWTDLTQTLGEVGKELRMTLSNIKLERTSTRAQRGPGASWEFSISGQRALLFDPVSGKWLAIDPGASGVKEEWESNQQLTQYLRTISLGDCSHWLQEFLQHWEDMLEPTDESPLHHEYVSTVAIDCENVTSDQPLMTDSDP
ncbi:Retinoic acid early transcript 1E [Galemys pyrenaicus]|uniref:Retinoic acid early transcript 1E n=1 Tax=Galemys pyrenaicus TaxID=202257 RepID=A0A8J6A220_GALPY|nr:Retinoic acid early transcript 1E [Galemys pyrenaicus]